MNEFKKVMLISPDTIKSYGDLNYNVDDEVIGASIRTVQNVYLTDVLGTDLVEKLQYLVYNDIKGLEDSIEDAENAVYKTLLEDYVKEAMGYRVVAEICLRISLKIRNMGVVQNSDTNVNYVSLDDIKYLRDTYKGYWDSAVNRMYAFLRQNRSAFIELEDCSSGCGESKIDIKAKFGNTGLWLG